jgi:hypothetical protein
VHHRCRCSPDAGGVARLPPLAEATPTSTARREQSRWRPSQPPVLLRPREAPRPPPPLRSRAGGGQASLSASSARREQSRRSQPPPHAGAAPAGDRCAYELCSLSARQGRHWHYVPLCRGARHDTILEMVRPCKCLTLGTATLPRTTRQCRRAPVPICAVRHHAGTMAIYTTLISFSPCRHRTLTLPSVPNLFATRPC